MSQKSPRTVLFVVALLALVALAACAPAPSATGSRFEVTGAWVRPAKMAAGGDAMGGMEANTSASAAYMVIKNTGGEPDVLVSVESDVAMAVELHNVKMENNVMSMFQVPGVDIPANGQAELKPGSFHVMLIGLTRDLNTGDTVTLTLNFEKGGSLTVEAAVRDE